MAEYLDYCRYVDDLIRALDTATGLSWAHQTTGGGCDCIETIDDQNRMIVITDGNACVPDTGDEWLIGIYDDADAGGTHPKAMRYVAGFASCLDALQKLHADGTITLRVRWAKL